MFVTIAALLLAVGVTPMPKAAGPIPVTTESYPFMAADKSTPDVDLSKVGYVEEEYLVTGTANVYDWAADGTVSVKTPNAPYTTRILVRRPRNGFSGNVIVEPLFTARRFDWSMMWGFSHNYIIDHKDAWVGITVPGSIDGLKKFNPTRYANLSAANPSPNAPCPGARGNVASPLEDGLKFDVMSQVGALLKGDLLKAQYLFLTSQGADVATYANAIRATLQNGKPVYDGYLLKAPFTMGRINQCAPAPAANDPRQGVKNVGAPVIAVAAQGEIIGGGYARRDDSDEANDRFRLYEVASAGHIDKSAYFGFPGQADQEAAVGTAQGTVEWPFTAVCTPEIPLMDPSLIGLVFNASFAALDQWVRKGTPAPRAPRIELQNAGTPQAGVVTDKLGHGVGGVRTPFIDVPDATYFTSSPGPGTCREMGHKAPFDAAKITELYGSRKNYASRFTEAVDRLVKERWLTPGDAKRLKQAVSAGSN